MSAKKILGQYFTTRYTWLMPQVEEFIVQSGCTAAYDPFAGKGDLLQAVVGLGMISELYGLDIDPCLNWKLNDSLLGIPHIDNAIIVTNPPYLAKFSAKRKNIADTLLKYYHSSGFVDIYQLALANCLLSSEYVVAIIPETFINSRFPLRNRLSQLTVLEVNPFTDTENPVCVACFDGRVKATQEIKIFKNEYYVGCLGDLEIHRLNPRYTFGLRFNDINGQIALRAVDSPDPHSPIRFLPRSDLVYDLTSIKVSSRLITLISIGEEWNCLLTEIISNANQILNEYRTTTKDILLSPFKGNNKEGIRRRRLDYRSARAILEKAVEATGLTPRYLKESYYEEKEPIFHQG